MQSILRWSLENSTPQDSAASDRPPVQRKDLDPAIIDMILGKPDSVQMKEDMEVAVDVSKTEDERIEALDHLEMLIENIDNANDLMKLKLWEPLLSLLSEDSATLDIKTQALWVVGTAVQNNPSAQDACLTFNPLPVIVSFLNPSSTSSASRAKAIYVLSGLLKHNAPAVQAFGQPEIDGWTKLRSSLQEPAISVRRKAIFLLSTLLIPTWPIQTPAPPATLLLGPGSPSQTDSTSAPNILTPDTRPAPVSDAPSSEPIHPNSHSANLKDPARTATSNLTVSAFAKHQIIDAIITSLTNPLPHGDDGENTEADPDYEEKAMRLLYTFAVTCVGPLSKDQKVALRNWIQAEKTKESGGEKGLLERWGLTREEYAALIGKLL